MVSTNRQASKLRVFSPMFEEDEIPLTTLFRSYESMPEIERKALDMAKGRVLDVGAGAGCHSLVLQEKGLDVTAIDISPLSVRTMKERGVKKVLEQDFFTLDGQYDTILMLMNGIGIVGTLERMPEFFKQLNKILAQGGRGMDKRILSTCSIQTPKGYSTKVYLNMSWKLKYRCKACGYERLRVGATAGMAEVYEGRGLFRQQITAMSCPDCKTIQNFCLLRHHLSCQW